MSLIERLRSPVAVQSWLKTADGQELVGYFQEMLAKATKTCLGSNNPTEIFYSQGVAEAAGIIVSLESDIKKYLDDVRTGKIKPKIEVK